MTLFATVIRSIAALVLIGCAFVSSYTLACRFGGRLTLLVRACAVFTIGLLLATATFHILIHSGLFRLPVAMALIPSGTALILWKAGGIPLLQRELAFDARRIRCYFRLWKQSPYRGRVSFFGVFALALGIRCLLVPPLGWDTITYHAVKSALWVQQGSFELFRAPGGWGFYRLFPGGSELLVAWAMLPFHADVLASFVDFVEWSAMGIAITAFAHTLGVREPYGSTTAGFVLTIPTVRLVTGSGYVEPALMLAITLAFLFTVRALKHRRPLEAFLAFAALGVTCSIKLTVVAGLAFLFCASFFGWFRLHMNQRPKASLLLLCLCAVAMTWGPWLYHAFHETGYPLSPADARIGPLQLGTLTDALRWYHDRPIPPFTWESEVHVLRQVFEVPGTFTDGLSALVLLPMLFLFPGLFALLRRNWVVSTLVFSFFVTSWLGYLSKNYAVVRYFWSVNSSRFLLPMLCVTIPASAAWCRRKNSFGTAYLTVLWACVVLNLVFYSMPYWTPDDTRAVFIAAAVLGAGTWILWRLHTGFRRVRWTLSGVLIALLALSVVLIRRWDRTRLDLMSSASSYHTINKHWVSAIPWIDAPPRRLRIAVTSRPSQVGDHWFLYYFMGRYFQNRLLYVPPTQTGEIVEFDPTYRLAAQSNPSAWLIRLAKQKITHVMSFFPHSRELEWMQERPEFFRRLAGDGTGWGLYEFRAPSMATGFGQGAQVLPTSSKGSL